MLMLSLIVGLFALAILCPVILPNHKVSSHQKDSLTKEQGEQGDAADDDRF